MRPDGHARGVEAVRIDTGRRPQAVILAAQAHEPLRSHRTRLQVETEPARLSSPCRASACGYDLALRHVPLPGAGSIRSSEVLVYPRPEASAVPLPLGSREAQRSVVQPQGDEFGALREYRASDPRRLIAWKASARHDRLLVREPEQLTGQEFVLDFNAMPALDLEARIARLTRWVLMAEERRSRYTLVLPGQRIGPDLGSSHARRCLRELALL